MMFCKGNRRGDVERGTEDQELSEMSMPGELALPQHEEIEFRRQHQSEDFHDGANDLWSLYGKEALVYDESRIKTLKDDMGSVLIFAGLFSAVLTAFVVPKIQDLKANPADQSAYFQNQTVHLLGRISQQLASMGNQISTNSNLPLPNPTFHMSASDRRANIFWLLSLVSSLFAAFLATLVQQWSKDYMQIFQQTDNPLQIARFRVFFLEGSERLPVLAEVVHGLIHFSLILFFWGIGEIILQIDTAIFAIILGPTAVCVCLYLYCTIAPILNPQSPYRTPLSGFICFLIQIFSRDPRHGHFHGKEAKPTSIKKRQEKSSLEEAKSRMNRDVRAIQWLVKRTNGSDEMQALVLAIPSSFDGKWGREVWKGVVGDHSASLANRQARSHLDFSSARKGTTVHELCRRVKYFFETYKDEGDFMDTAIGRMRMRGYVETTASLVCCLGVELDSFGEVAVALSEVGDKEQTKDPLSIKSNPLFVVRWTCLSLVAIKQIVNNNQLQELAKLALDSIVPFQTNLGRRDTVEMVLRAARKMDEDLKKAWEAISDVRLALEPWSLNQNRTESEIRSILNTCEEWIQDLERIAVGAVGMVGMDWRIRYLQETMEGVTHKLTRRLPGVSFYELPPATPNTTTEASDLPSVQAARIPPQFIFPAQQLQSIYSLGQRLRDITERQNTDWNEALESLKYLREVPIPLCLNYLMERQLWRLLDLVDGGGLGFTIELFFLVLRQLSSATSSLDNSLSSEMREVIYTGTFNVIKSNWEKSKDSAGTQRILLDLLSDLIIQGRGIFSDFRYPPYIVKMLLDLVGEMVKGHEGLNPSVNEVIEELEDYNLRNRMDNNLRNKALFAICPPPDVTAPS